MLRLTIVTYFLSSYDIFPWMMVIISWFRDAVHDLKSSLAYQLKLLKIDTRGSSDMPIGLHELGVVSKALESYRHVQNLC
jgi:hypothetical protein